MGGGLHRKKLYVIAGRTGEGKSSLALSMARRMALQHGQRVLYFSLEMDNVEVIERLLCQELLLTVDELEHLRKTALLEKTLHPLLGRLRTSHLHIEDTRSPHIDDLDLLLETMMPQVPDVLFIDHLQHMRFEGDQPQATAIHNYMVDLKALAKRRNLAIVLCSQINRSGHLIPELIHLKGSGGIEEVANVVMICNRINYESARSPSDLTTDTDYEVWVAKQRRGPEYKFNLLFRAACFEFLEPASYQAPKLVEEIFPVGDHDAS